MAEKMITGSAERVSTQDKTDILQNEHIKFNQNIDDDWRVKEKKLVRKLDMTLMPVVWVLYLFNYLDRNNIAQARLNSFEGDLVLATAFSGLVAAGIFAGLDGTAGLAGWRWLFIIESAASFVAAIAAMFILPDYPESKTGSGRWLFTESERQFAVERIARDRVSTPENDRSVFHGLKLAVVDYRTWIFVLLLCANHTAYGFNNYFPTIMKAFNLGNTTLTLILTSPPYLVGAIISFLVAFSSDRNNERGFHIAVPIAVAVVGFVISVSTLNVPARYFGSFLYTSGCFSANAMVYSWAASTLNQTSEKRACATSIVNLLSQFGNVWSPYFFPKADGPRYLMAMLLMMGFSFLSIVCCMVMKCDLKRANHRLKAKGEEEGKDVVLFAL
ncbi:uncharacterized protein A1O9_05367 [Exophiala aquamarina CBS 119918]|uniref:Major facilitator superfamily (MFS) profile domain-containing protein n=1 Tax=Exophiala aquamarina CBS 119918 TaxID=1182545 RepID=A0A072PPK7_9EURO|nr:uncharacterized protein A1O9_05367 [Exophiala aquamarina CBS 119918]KEF57450.1 hypothetical protein A1O9_05367 [Exophiala aquamarina CBS 119918]